MAMSRAPRLVLNDHVDIAIQSMIPEAENAAVE
jgi:hypothetical protein